MGKLIRAISTKKSILLLLFMVCFCLMSCGKNKEVDNDIKSKEEINEEKTIEDNTEKKELYVGDYANEPVYKVLSSIEKCTTPDELCEIVDSIYATEFNYICMSYKESDNQTKESLLGYEAPYSDFTCFVYSYYDYNSPIVSLPVCKDTYLFFEKYSEVPAFIMTEDGTAIVSSYEIKNYEDGTSAKIIEGRVITDLFMCIHGYINEGESDREYLKRWR